MFTTPVPARVCVCKGSNSHDAVRRVRDVYWSTVNRRRFLIGSGVWLAVICNQQRNSGKELALTDRYVVASSSSSAETDQRLRHACVKRLSSHGITPRDNQLS
ncbi:hypothetical protein BaRGS_00030806 [Batillaria attramentaria]|uniref:Uncharacterized protein n=1 Tax=Batillaria attramentaria TaxID=370345 RepID=A0ABD0JTM0_9CAEN